MLIQVFEKIQLPIIRLIIEKLKFEGNDLGQWVEQKKEETSDIDRMALLLLRRLKPEILDAVVTNTELSYREIEQHIADNWGRVEVEIDQQYEDRAMEYLNQFIILGLLSMRGRPSAIIKQYWETLDEINEITDLTDAQEQINGIIQERYKRGLNSGYYDKNGYVWSLDRYVLNAEQHQTYDIWQAVLTMALSNLNVELVQIPIFSDPRPACEGLQAMGGVICVVPRNQASAVANQYPNIYDPEHLYGDASGHHGVNCRHAWSAIGNTSSQLYNRIDRENQILSTNRRERNEVIEQLLRR